MFQFVVGAIEVIGAGREGPDRSLSLFRCDSWKELAAPADVDMQIRTILREGCGRVRGDRWSECVCSEDHALRWSWRCRPWWVDGCAIADAAHRKTALNSFFFFL